MKSIVFCLLLVTVFYSCEKSDKQIELPDNLEGTWELQSVSCFCFYPEDFDFSTHRLNFNDDGISKIENGSETFFVSKSGTYDFRVEGDRIVINEVAFIYEIKANILSLAFIDNPEMADDEITLMYQKVTN